MSNRVDRVIDPTVDRAAWDSSSGLRTRPTIRHRLLPTLCSDARSGDDPAGRGADVGEGIVVENMWTLVNTPVDPPLVVAAFLDRRMRGRLP